MYIRVTTTSLRHELQRLLSVSIAVWGTVTIKICIPGSDFFFFFFFFFFSISLIADGPHHNHPACVPISPRFTPYNFLARCKFSTLTTRQPVVEFYLLTFPRFPLRKKEHKSYFGENRTHDFRTSRCAGYLLDHSGITGRYLGYRPENGHTYIKAPSSFLVCSSRSAV